MAIQSHPAFPFIETGTTLDYAQRGCYADDPNFVGTADEWIFKIDGCDGMILCQSAEDALLMAEEALFSSEGELVEEKESKAIAAGDIRLAMTLAEGRGYWAGKNEATRQMKELLAPALVQLKIAIS